MKLSAIRLCDVKCFAPGGIQIEGIPSGLSLLAQENEFGKSTIFEAVRLLLQQKHTAAGAQIKAFQPNSGVGAPLIEVDVETSNGRFRLTKRFLARKIARVLDIDTGEVVASGGDADAWISDLSQAGSKAGGPSGLLWVSQGQSMEQPSGGEHILPNMLEQEVGTLVGGQRARTFLQSCEEQLRELVTDSQQNPRGAYKSITSDLTRREDELADLESRQAGSEKLLKDLASVERSLAILDEQESNNELVEKQRVAKQTLAEAERRESSIKILRSEDEIAQSRRDAAAKAHVEFQQACELLNALQENKEITKATADSHSEALTTAKLNAETDKANWQRAYDTLSETRRSFQALRKHEAANAALVRSQEVAAKLKRARKIRDELALQKAQVKKNRFSGEILDNLSELRDRVVRAEAELNATRPSLDIELTNAGQKVVTLDGKPVNQASFAKTVSGDLNIGLGDLGAVRINLADQASLVEAADNASAELRTSLDALGADDLEDAREKGRQREEAVTRLAELDRDLKQLAPDGTETLEAELAEAEALVPDEFDPDAVPDKPAQDLETLERAEETARLAREASAELLGETRNGHTEATTIAEIACATYEEQLTAVGNEAKRLERETRLDDALSAADSVARTAAAALVEAEKDAPNCDMALAEVERLEAAIEGAKSQRSELMTERTAIVSKLEILGNEGIGEKFSEAEEEINVLRRRAAAYAAEVEALNLLKGVLRSTQSEMQAAYFKPISDELQPFLTKVIGDGSIRLGDDYRADSLKRGDYNETVDSLSGGTREQIAVLTRLAFAKLMVKQGNPAPVFLDDALVYCDDRRLEDMFTVLTLASKDIQCMILTCHERQFATLGGSRLRPSPWTPEY